MASRLALQVELILAVFSTPSAPSEQSSDRHDRWRNRSAERWTAGVVSPAVARLEARGAPAVIASARGEVVQVGKIDDPATARRGETVYEFLPRNIWGNICDGRQTETRRLAAKGIPLRSPRNRCPHPPTTPLLPTHPLMPVHA